MCLLVSFRLADNDRQWLQLVVVLPVVESHGVLLFHLRFLFIMQPARRLTERSLLELESNEDEKHS